PHALHTSTYTLSLHDALPILTFGCNLKMDAGHSSVIGPFSVAFTAAAFLSPDDATTICFASIISARPIVNIWVGASSLVKPQYFIVLKIVDSSLSARNKRESKGVPGSFAAKCAFTPKPTNCKSLGYFCNTAE